MNLVFTPSSRPTLFEIGIRYRMYLVGPSVLRSLVPIRGNDMEVRW